MWDLFVLFALKIVFLVWLAITSEVVCDVMLTKNCCVVYLCEKFNFVKNLRL